jgi:hypothetical protein
MNDEKALALAEDILLIVKDGKIPDHEHWNEGNCNNLRNLIAALVRKHFDQDEP